MKTTKERLMQAIDDNKIVRFNGSLYRVGGYVVRKERGEIKRSVILYDQTTRERSTIQLPLQFIEI